MFPGRTQVPGKKVYKFPGDSKPKKSVISQREITDFSNIRGGITDTPPAPAHNRTPS